MILVKESVFLSLNAEFVDLKSKIDIIIKKYEVLESQGFIFNFVVGGDMVPKGAGMRRNAFATS